MDDKRATLLQMKVKGLTKPEAKQALVLWECIPSAWLIFRRDADFLPVEFATALSKDARRKLQRAMEDNKGNDESTLRATMDQLFESLLSPTQAKNLAAARRIKELEVVPYNGSTINNCMWDRALDTLPGADKLTKKERVSKMSALSKVEQLRLVEAEIGRRGGLDKVNADLVALMDAKEAEKKPRPTYDDFVNAGCTMNGMCRCPICSNPSDYKR